MINPNDVVRCVNQHFFDGGKYEVCPHCHAPRIINTVEEPFKNDSEMKKKKMFGFFDFKKKEVSEYEVEKEMYTVESVDLKSENTGELEHTLDLEKKEEKSKKNGDKTLDFWRTENDRCVLLAEENVDFDENNQEIKNDKKVPPTESVFNKKVEKNDEGGSLIDEVKEATASSGEKTVSYFSQVTSTAEKQSQKHESIDPTVGWLVCIDGKSFGRTFNIFAGVNSIGRNETNKIVLNGDNGISREKHAVIIYDPKNRDFYIKSGDGSGLTYLNGDCIIDGAKVLHNGDVIELGSSKFMFVPLCGDNFTWDDYIVKG